MAERASEVTELKRSLAQALRDKEQLQEVKQRHTATALCIRKRDDAPRSLADSRI